MLKKTLTLLVLLFILTFNIVAQDNILFTVSDTKVNKSEFDYIYQKNNFNNKADYSKKSLEDYLNLYINFRLKVKEALAQGLDKSDKFKEELNAYEKQLIDSYVDREIIEKLVKEEYERAQKDLNISHVFISTNNNNEKESLVNAKAFLKKLKAGISFDEVAKSSDDKQTAQRGGNLGWFNSYQMSLPEIEEAVYNMKTGEVSDIIKTRLGFHILKLNDSRPARPRIKVAIIKRYFSISDTSAKVQKNIEDTVKLAYAKLKSNVTFESVVKQFSEDELTKNNKGELDWFSINKYAKVFEETAYALKDGEISAPFKTATAWYIIKRLETEKPMKYEEAIPMLKVKLQNAPQFQYQMDKYLDKINDKLNVVTFNENIVAFKNRIINLAQKNPFTYIDTISPKTLIQIGKKIFTENDFGKNIQTSYYTLFVNSGMDKYDELIKKATQDIVLGYYKNDIKENNEEYKSLMNEYKNGIMIFSLSEKNIWNKASEDSVGLMAFYKENKLDFNLKKRATIRTIFVDNDKQAKEVIKILNANKEISDEVLSEKMKAFSIANPKINSLVQSEEKTTLNINVESISKPLTSNNKIEITQVYNLQQPKTREFNECRGYVVAAYQEYLEKRWIAELKQKFPVTINKVTFESLVKK